MERYEEGEGWRVRRDNEGQNLIDWKVAISLQLLLTGLHHPQEES